MRAITAIATKDVRMLMRDKMALFWVFAFPLMFALFFGSLFGGGDDLPGSVTIAVVDEDGSQLSQVFTEQLDSNDAIVVPRIELPEGETGEGAFQTPTLEAAREGVQKGRHIAYLRIPQGFGDNPFAIFGAGGDSGDDSVSLEVGIDPRRKAEAGMLQGVVIQSLFSSLQSQFLDTELMQNEISELRADIAAAPDLDESQKSALDQFMGSLDTFLLDFEPGSSEDGTAVGLDMSQMLNVVEVARERGNQPRSAFEISFPQALVWGLMSVAMAFAITMVRERTSGTLLRLQMAPISTAQLLAGKALACFAASMGTMTLLMSVAVIALGVRFDSFGLFLLAMVCTALCFTGITMLVSVMGKTESAVSGAAWGMMMPFAMVGGGMIPLIAMPGWLAALSNFSPFKWAILAVEGGLWRGFSLAEMTTPCLVLIAIGVVAFTTGAFIFNRTKS